MRKGKIKAIIFIIVFLLVMATAITLLLDMEREKQEVANLGYDPYRATPAPTAAPTVTPMPVSTIMPTPVRSIRAFISLTVTAIIKTSRSIYIKYHLKYRQTPDACL